MYVLFVFPISASVTLPSKGQIMSLSDAISEFWRESANLQGGLDFKIDHFCGGVKFPVITSFGCKNLNIKLDI